MNKIRGFEKISSNQYQKDFKDINNLCFSNEYYPEDIYATSKEIKLPKRATSLSAGYDVFSPLQFRLCPNEEIKLPTGIKAYMQNDEVLKAYPRSGLGFKYYLRLANTVGIIDADYYNNQENEGHIWVKLRNEGSKTMIIKKGEAVCQFMFEKYYLADGDSFDGDKRVGGFGSTTNS